MNCYEHPEVAAVGVCCNCGRGLCARSAADVQGKLACKDRCEAQVAHAARLMKASSAPGTRYVGLLFGAIFLLTGVVLLAITHEPFWLFLIAVGAVYVGFTLNVLLRLRRP